MKVLMILSLLFIAATGNKTEARCIECEKEIQSKAQTLKTETKTISQLLTSLLQAVETMSKEKEDRCIECEKEMKDIVGKAKTNLETIDQTLAGLLQVVSTLSNENAQLSQKLKDCEGILNN